MYRDTSQITIPSDPSCIYIQDDKTIILQNETLDQEQIYTLIGDKYMLTKQTEFTGAQNPDVLCLTTQQLSTLPSNYDFMAPVYHNMAILSVILILFAAYKFVIYPFFRIR